jgi:hypothetical protein
LIFQIISFFNRFVVVLELIEIMFVCLWKILELIFGLVIIIYYLWDAMNYTFDSLAG